MTTIARKYWSDEELLGMPKDGYKREIVNGEVVMSPASFDHGNLINRLVSALGNVVYAGRLGELGDGQTGIRLKSGDLFCPDIAFVVADRVAQHRRTNNAFFEGAPDLIVEVLSPSDTIEIMEEKLRQFFDEGTRLAWIVHPRTRSVHVYRSLTQSHILTATDELQGEELIPGFSILVAKLFP